MGRVIRKLSNEEFLAEKSVLMDELKNGGLSLGEATKRMRLILGMSQEEYATNIVKINKRTLLEIENDNANPRLETLEKIAKPFGLSVRFI